MSERKLLRVQQHSHLARDPYSKAIINTDASALQQAKLAKEKFLKRQEKVENVENRLNKIEEDMNEIKGLLTKLLSK